MKIVAYTYESDVHCIDCTKERFDKFHVDVNGLDEHGIPNNCVDKEGNLIHPIFSTDYTEFTHCGSCGQELLK